MFENPRKGGQARNFYNKCSENSRSQMVFRTDIFQKLTLGAPVFLIRYHLVPQQGTKKIDRTYKENKVVERYAIRGNLSLTSDLSSPEGG